MIGVAFVNFHSEAMIAPKVLRLQAAGFAVRVADNSQSYPDTEERVEMTYNAGFGAGCNRAAEALPPAVDTVCFHNPDADLPVEHIGILAQRLRLEQVPGLIAPAERVGSLLRPAGYRYPSLAREIGISARWRLRRASRADEDPAAGPVRTASVSGRRFASGALLVADRAAHVAIAGFDERYFMYGEDLDYWHRMRRSGRSASFAPDLVVHHAMGTGSPLAPAKREILRWLGIELFLQLQTNRWQHVRLIHRVSLAALAVEARRLGDEVRALWRQGLSPVEVSARLRPAFEYGRLLG